MRTTFRLLVAGLTVLVGTAAMAQQPYTLIVQGTVAGCTPYQQVVVSTIAGTTPSYSYTLEVLPQACFFDTILDIGSTWAGISVTTMCSGMVIAAYDSTSFNFFGDTAVMTLDLNCGGGGGLDCLGILNGPNVVGSACDDNDPLTMNDMWSVNCQCTGTGGVTLDCLGVPGGANMPGTECVTAFGFTGIWSLDCWCEVDTTGGISDCLGVPNGPAMPGTPCDDNNPLTNNDVWSVNCQCVGNGGGNVDCLGVPGGTNLPGTVCVYSPDSGLTWLTGIWSNVCQCEGNGGPLDCLGVPGGTNLPGTACVTPLGLTGIWGPDCWCDTDTTGSTLDCLGIPGGSNLPGTPCWVFGTNTLGTWDANCDCITGGVLDCEAAFWAMQAMTADSSNPNGMGDPIPFEVWVWNLSSGTGNMSYSWDFGDGSTSTDPYPTHTYADEGPYLLCLSITDGSGCTDQYCDSISIDPDGILSGMIVDGELDGSAARQDGFTINVQNPLTTGVSDASMLSNLALWPNPAADAVNLALVSHANGQLGVSLFDVNGREVMRENRTLAAGRSQHTIDTSALPAGIYTVRATDREGNSISLRFVKQ